MISDRFLNALIVFITVVLVFVAQLIVTNFSAAATPDSSYDRAVEIAKRSRDRVESSGSLVKASSQKLFSEFAGKTGELQKLLDTRQRLEKAGMLDKNDSTGKLRRAHINAQIILAVGELKSACDGNLDTLLSSLDAFDRAIADSIVDTQATRSINANYELTLNTFKQKEKTRFFEAAGAAEELLNQINSTRDADEKNRLVAKYARVKKRLNRIRQRRMLYESRLKVAAMNQRISAMVREKIRQQGSEVPSKFRAVMSGLYTSFGKVVPVAETGGTGSIDVLENFGFGNIKELSDTLEIVEASALKLDNVLDKMVNDVIGGLDEIKIMDDATVTAGSMSIEKEMEAINKERAAWEKG